MKVHFLSECLPPFSSVNEFPAESEPEANVIAASPPLPDSDVGSCGGARPVRCPVDVGIVTGAGFDGPFCACAGHGVRHSCAGDGVDEGCFAAPCGRV